MCQKRKIKERTRKKQNLLMVMLDDIDNLIMNIKVLIVVIFAIVIIIVIVFIIFIQLCYTL